MSDTTIIPDAPPVLNLPPTPPLPNTPEARLPDGTIKDQSLITTPTPETTPTDKTPEPPKEGEPKAPVVPETYSDFKVPEGVTLKPDALKEASGIFKELRLTQEQAQKLVDFYGKDIKATVDAPQATFNTMVDGWKADVLKDPSLASGDGLRTDVKENIGKLKATLGPASEIAAFDQLMNMSGLGNNPVIVKALNAWGKALGEGKHVAGGGPSPLGQKAPGAAERPSVAAAMFPNLPQR